MGRNTAVLHLRIKDPQKVYYLASRVAVNMLASESVFPNPDPSIEIFDAETKKLIDAINAKDGSKLQNQLIIDQMDVVFAMLKLFAFYVNSVADGNKVIILQSGFDCNHERLAHPIPDKAVIRRIDDGSTSCSAKIYLERLHYADRFKIEITSTPYDAKSWKKVIDFGSIYKLEVKDLAYGQKVYFRVSGGNTHGWGSPSEPVRFIPR